MNPKNLDRIHRQVVQCTACPRLRRYCQNVAEIKRRSFLSETYWGKPIQGFGDPKARLVLIGLAPAAHGANRTGRIFTGDRSGDWLYRALHKAGFANQPTAVSAHDGLVLSGAYVSCVVKCAPPDNKPLPVEMRRCAGFLSEELAALTSARVYLALGQIALTGAWPLLVQRFDLPKGTFKKPRFSHGGCVDLREGRSLLMSYHPSQQNTFTGRLTEPMFDSVFEKAKELLTHSTSRQQADD